METEVSEERGRGIMVVGELGRTAFQNLGGQVLGQGRICGLKGARFIGDFGR